jgi:hypothetical protein
MNGPIFNLRGQPWRVLFPKRIGRGVRGLCFPSAKRPGGTIRVLDSL